jgi:hypothetical protein
MYDQIAAGRAGVRSAFDAAFVERIGDADLQRSGEIAALTGSKREHAAERFEAGQHQARNGRVAETAEQIFQFIRVAAVDLGREADCGGRGEIRLVDTPEIDLFRCVRALARRLQP